MERESLVKLTKGLPSKSAKMRALASAGYTRSEIAKALGVRYQFVRNVLLNEQASNFADRRAASPKQGEAVRLTLTPSGQLVLPKSFREMLNRADTVVARVEGDEIRLYSPETALRRAQDAVRRYVPEDISLTDELIADRRKESEE